MKTCCLILDWCSLHLLLIWLVIALIVIHWKTTAVCFSQILFLGNMPFIKTTVIIENEGRFKTITWKDMNPFPRKVQSDMRHRRISHRLIMLQFENQPHTTLEQRISGKISLQGLEVTSHYQSESLSWMKGTSKFVVLQNQILTSSYEQLWIRQFEVGWLLAHTLL